MVGAPPETVRLGKVTYAVLLSKNRRESLQHRASPHEKREQKFVQIMFVRDVVCSRERWAANAAARKDFLTSLVEREIQVTARKGGQW